MDSYGMLGDYRINRPLTDEEEQQQLKQTVSHHHEPGYDLSLIKINSTFAESVDKFYQARGFMAMNGFIVMSFILVISFLFLKSLLESPDWTGWLGLVFIPLFLFGLWLFRKDAFTYTHYPIRFNRKNRMVYVWQRDGTVLKAAWDTLFFTIISANSSPVVRYHSVAGHLLAEDNITVKATFSLSYNGSHDQLKSHFEFYRRYMEESPKRAFELSNNQTMPLYCLPPLDKEKESFIFGWQRTTAQFNGMAVMQLLFQVFFIPESLFRWVVMQTSDIPKWPEWVEQECAIEPNDPFVHDYTTNKTTLYGNPLPAESR